MQLRLSTQMPDIQSSENEYGDNKTFRLELEAKTEEQDHFEIVSGSGTLQGFVRSKSDEKGVVTEHEEDEDVYEIYFLISGSIKVVRGTKEYTLTTNLNMIDLPSSTVGNVTISPDFNSATLALNTGDGNEPIEINGFIIPPNTNHSAEIVDQMGENPVVTRYVAIKVKRN